MTTQQPSGLLKDKRLWGILAGFLLLGVGGYAFLNARSQQKQAELEAASQPLPEQVKVAALGRVEPAGGIVNVAASEMGVVSRLLVEAGDRVTKGQILGYLDIYSVLLAERDYAQSQLTEARVGLRAQTKLEQARIAEANSRLAQIDGPQAQSIRAQEAAIGDLEAQLNLARIDLNRFETLAARGAIAQQNLDSKRAEVTQLGQKIAAAEATLSQLAAARSADIRNATAQVGAAEANFQVSQANAGVFSAERNLALADAQLERAILKAPIAGQVIEVFIDPGETTGGESGSQAILSVGKTQEMQVVAEVYETDIGLVDIGQRATVRSRNGAFDDTLTGTVEKIALQIFKNDVLDDDPAANADARVVEVDIAIDQPEAIRGLTNLQVDVVIDVED